MNREAASIIARAFEPRVNLEEDVVVPFIKATGREVTLQEISQKTYQADEIEIRRLHYPLRGILDRIRRKGGYEIEERTFRSPEEAQNYINKYRNSPDLTIQLRIGKDWIRYRLFHGKDFYEQRASFHICG